MLAVWPGICMVKDVQGFIQHCRHCQANHQRPSRHCVTVTDIFSQPFEICGADLVGPLPQSTSGHWYVLTYVDHLSGRVQAIYPSDKTQNVIWKALEREISS